MVDKIRVNTTVLEGSISGCLSKAEEYINEAMSEISKSTDAGSKLLRVTWKFKGKDELFDKIATVEKKLDTVSKTVNRSSAAAKKAARKFEELENELANGKKNLSLMSQLRESIGRFTSKPLFGHTPGKLWAQLMNTFNAKNVKSISKY